MNIPVINITNKIPNQVIHPPIIYKISKIVDKNDEFTNYEIYQKKYYKEFNSKIPNYQQNKSNKQYNRKKYYIKYNSYEYYCLRCNH